MDAVATVIIVITAAVVLAIIIIAVAVISTNKNHKPSEIHFSGGADLDNGRLSSDYNYFKGVSGVLGDTLVVDERRSSASDSERYVVIKNLANGKSEKVMIMEGLVIGRSNEKGVYSINDKAVSKNHCGLTVKNRKLYLSDLNSSNHTYLNGIRVYQDAEVNNGDIIKIGNTKLMISYLCL